MAAAAAAAATAAAAAALAAAQGNQGNVPNPQLNPQVIPQVQPAPIYRPTKPKMGDTFQSTNTEYVAWTGGTPLLDWTGLDPSAPTVPKSPNQYRPSQVAASQKGYNFRVVGISPLLQRVVILSPSKMTFGTTWWIEV